MRKTAKQIERAETAADWAFSHVVECCLTDCRLARAELLTRIAEHSADPESCKWTNWTVAHALAMDPHWLRHAVRAARVWGPVGGNPESYVAELRCGDAAARVLSTYFRNN